MPLPDDELPSRTPATLPLKKPAPPVTEEVSPVVEEAPVEEKAVAKIEIAPVQFQPPPSDEVHRSSLTLGLHCPTPDAVIRYALDDEELNADSPVYDSGKLLLTQSTRIQAQAFVGEHAGPVSSAEYQIQRPIWEKREPEDQTDPVSHEYSASEELPAGWKLAAASLRGKLHAHRGLWREDSCAFAVQNEWSIVAVSDGAGSSALSRIGSNAACQAAVASLQSTLQSATLEAQDEAALKEKLLPELREILVQAGRAALEAIRAESSTRSQPLSAFAATLLVLVRREWNGAQLCAALQAGDGSIALWSDDGAVTILGVADHGEHSSETRFLTTSGMEDELAARVLFSIKNNLSAVAVMTDGISDDYFPERERLPELFTSVLPALRSTPAPDAALLQWIDYEKKGSSDDRTLVVCWRENEPEA